MIDIKTRSFLGSLVILFMLQGCAVKARPETKGQDRTVASSETRSTQINWEDVCTLPPPINRFYPGRRLNLLHQGDPNLAGIRVDHNIPHDPPRKSWMHPTAIHYFFWNGLVDMVAYNEDGTIDWSRNQWYRATDWGNVDFSYGSDPDFKRHKRPQTSVNE